MTSRSSKSNGNNKNYQHKNNRIQNNLMIGDFKIGAKLGQGTFSKVCQGIHMPTGEKVAIKIMSKDQIKEKNDQIRIEKEINIQKKLHHQNIVQQYAIIETKSTIYIISEYCSGGELFDYIVSKRKLYEVEACRIYQQLISGLEYLHKQRICHRDLKPENLLFDSKHILKIADFGLSNDYHKGKLSTPCGSPCYAAPEMVTGKKYNGMSVDIWSSGIVLYTMVCGFLPFEDDNQNILFGKIAKGLFSLPSFLSPSCKDLLKKILVTDPKKRYGFEEIKHHSWFMSVNNVMGKNFFFNSPGVFIEEDVIPIDIEIIAEIYNDFHFDISKIINEILRNRHNKITTTYYLILKRKMRNNETSVSDISSNSTSFIKYIKSSISKMGYWNNDYEKITEYYAKSVKKFLNSISEENSMSNESRNKNIGNILGIGPNKENINNNLKTSEINTDKLLNKIMSNNSNNIINTNNTNNPNDFYSISESNNISTKSNKNHINNKQNITNSTNSELLNHPMQNGGIYLGINTLYNDKNIPKIPIKNIMDSKNEKNINNNKVNYEMDTEEPPTQNINQSYRPKIITQVLQTDINNIKMKNRLIKETNNLEKALNKFNISLNNKVFKSEESTNIGDNTNNKNYFEQKETAMSGIDRILLTEIGNDNIKNIQNSLLNNTSKENNNALNYAKNLTTKNDELKSNENNNQDYIRMNTLYNKDDSDENIKININENNKDKNKNNVNLEISNNNDNDLPKEINGLNENNISNNNKRNNSVDKNKIEEYSNKNRYNNNINQNKEKEKANKFIINMVSFPFSNQIYKKLTAYSDKEKIQKFINSSFPKKEEQKKESIENGKLLLNNKNKYKNKYSQDHNNYIYNGIQTKANGSNEMAFVNRNINNINDILYIKKKKRPKSIDENKNYKHYKELKLKEKINNSFNRKDSKTNINNNNNDYYSKIKNTNKIIYKDLINERKYLDQPYIDSFRYKNMNMNMNKKANISKLNKKMDMNDMSNISHILNKRNNNYNYFADKIKNNDNYMILNKDQNNYTNITTNKNRKLNEHNSFDIPKNIKNKINKNYMNLSIEKDKENNNHNNHYFKLNKKMNRYYRNINNKYNPTITQYYGINNHNNINNYNIDNYNKLSNEKLMLSKRINNYNHNYRIVDKIKSNSVDMPLPMSTTRTKESNEIKKLKSKRKIFLNTSTIKDKTSKKIKTSFLIDNNKNKKNNNIMKNKYYLNTMENNNNYIKNTNMYKSTDEGRYLTFKDNESINANSIRTNQFKYLFPTHKRCNFSQEPEKKRRENDAFEIFTTSMYGKGNSFILSNPSNFVNKMVYKNYKNLIYDKQNRNKYEIKNNGNNGMNIYSNKSFEKVKEYVEIIIGNKTNITKHKNSPNKLLECKYKEGNNIINFILNISQNSQNTAKKNYFVISPTLIKGNSNIYNAIIEKIKNKLK